MTPKSSLSKKIELLFFMGDHFKSLYPSASRDSIRSVVSGEVTLYVDIRAEGQVKEESVSTGSANSSATIRLASEGEKYLVSRNTIINP